MEPAIRYARAYVQARDLALYDLQQLNVQGWSGANLEEPRHGVVLALQQADGPNVVANEPLLTFDLLVQGIAVRRANLLWTRAPPSYRWPNPRLCGPGDNLISFSLQRLR